MRSAAVPLRAKTICFADIESVPIEWLWPGRIALGKLTMIAGDPGLGKSLITVALAEHVSTGTPWPVDRSPCQVGDVVLLSAEDDPGDTVRPRLDAARANVRRIHTVSMIREADENGKSFERFLSLKRDVNALDELLQTMPSCRLLVVDPVTAYLDGTDSHKNADVRGLLAPLASLAGRRRVAIVCVTHLNKGGSSTAMYRATGSLAFVAASRAYFQVTKDSENPNRRLVLPVKNNLAPDQAGVAYSVTTGTNGAPTLLWEDDPVEMSADEALAYDHPEDTQSGARECQDWLRELLVEGSMQASVVQKEARQAGFSDKNLRTARARLGIKPGRRAFAGGWSWSLPSLQDAQGAQDAQQ